MKLQFLTDAQVNFKLVEILRKLEWDVETVYKYNLGTEKNDANILAFAHSIGRVLLSFDNFRKDVWIEIAAELITNGGKLINIGGGPGQPPERAVGKLLFFQELWLPFLEKYDGRARIRDIKQECILTRSTEMRTSIEISRVSNFDEYLRRREAAKKVPAKRKSRRKKDQLTQSFDVGS